MFRHPVFVVCRVSVNFLVGPRLTILLIGLLVCVREKKVMTLRLDEHRSREVVHMGLS